MSLQPDNTYACDRCGTDVGNAGIYEAATVSDLHPDDNNIPRVLHLCRKPIEGAPRGCVGYALGAGTLAHWTERQGT